MFKTENQNVLMLATTTDVFGWNWNIVSCAISPLASLFLNTCSLHLHFKDISSNHNMLASDIVILCETHLMKTNSSIELIIHGFSCINRNDQISSSYSCPPHGWAAYVKNGIKIIEFQEYSSDQFEAICVCLCHPDDMKPVQIMGVYASAVLQWDVLKEEINRFMHNIDTTSVRTVIVGDFNTKSIMSKSINYNQNITDNMFSKVQHETVCSWLYSGAHFYIRFMF